MSSNPTNLVASPQTPVQVVVDAKSGRFNRDGLKWAQGITQAVNNALTLLGVFNGIIGTKAQIQGRVGTLANITQNLTATGQLQATHLTGVIASAQLPAADPLTQGAVIAPGNVLGTAALQPDTAFDPAGAAATAQANAIAASDPAGSAATALATANAYTNNRFGITYGTGAPAGAPSTTFALYFDTTGSPYHGYVYDGGWQQFS